MRSDLDDLERELANVLAENTLASEIECFRSEPSSAVHYVDRHVLDVIDDTVPLSVRASACRVALELARAWHRDRAAMSAPAVLISEPYVLVDDSWIRGDTNAPPPHVILCIARDAASFKPAPYNTVAAPRASSGHAMIDTLLDGTVRLGRIDPDLEVDDSGTWVLEPC